MGRGVRRVGNGREGAEGRKERGGAFQSRFTGLALFQLMDMSLCANTAAVVGLVAALGLEWVQQLIKVRPGAVLIATSMMVASMLMISTHSAEFADGTIISLQTVGDACVRAACYRSATQPSFQNPSTPNSI